MAMSAETKRRLYVKHGIGPGKEEIQARPKTDADRVRELEREVESLKRLVHGEHRIRAGKRRPFGDSCSCHGVTRGGEPSNQQPIHG